MQKIVTVGRKGFTVTLETDDMPDLNICHRLVEEAYPERLKVRTETAVTASSAAVICTIKDVLTGESLSRVGEIPLSGSEKPVSAAYDMAYQRAVTDFLVLKVRLENELPEEEEIREGKTLQPCAAPVLASDSPKTEEGPSLTDDTVLLIGRFKGRTFGDVKALPQFLRFLEQLKSASGKLSFSDAERSEQLKQLEQYAQTVCA